MKAKMSVEGRTRVYELVLTEKEAWDLVSLYAESVASQYLATGERFQLFSNPGHFSKAFNVLSTDPDTYYAYVGGICPKTTEELERLIASKGRIPIEMPSPLPGDKRPLNLGYIVLKLERESAA